MCEGGRGNGGDCEQNILPACLLQMVPDISKINYTYAMDEQKINITCYVNNAQSECFSPHI